MSTMDQASWPPPRRSAAPPRGAVPGPGRPHPEPGARARWARVPVDRCGSLLPPRPPGRGRPARRHAGGAAAARPARSRDLRRSLPALRRTGPPLQGPGEVGPRRRRAMVEPQRLPVVAHRLIRVESRPRPQTGDVERVTHERVGLGQAGIERDGLRASARHGSDRPSPGRPGPGAMWPSYSEGSSSLAVRAASSATWRRGTRSRPESTAGAASREWRLLSSAHAGA